MTTTVKAVLDRIVDGQDAVLLVESEGGVTDEIVVEVDELEAGGRAEGSIHEIRIDETTIEEIAFLQEETEHRRENAQERLDGLSEPLGEAADEDQ
jgi:hypothetical protein